MLQFKRSYRYIILLFSLQFSICCASAQKVIPVPYINPVWEKPCEPFRIAGNLYYVGTYDLASYLITTPQGHILINTGLASSVPVIRKNVEELGFKFTDIKILLCTHTHYDHVGGMAAIKKITGAEMMVNEGDVASLEDGGNSDYLMGGKGSMFVPVEVDRVLHEHDTIRLGGMKVIALHHPGHTKGATSFLFDVRDEQRSYRVLIANMPTVLEDVKPGMASYPEVAKDFGNTFKAMKELKFDLFLASHASQFDLDKKHQPGDGYNPMAFADKKGYDEALAGLEKDYKKKLGKK